METQKYYKCVSLRTGKRTSLVLKQEEVGKYVKEYSPYQWTNKIKDSLGIFVFSSLQSAKFSANIESDAFEIWECDVRNPVNIEFICGSFREDTFNNFYEFRNIGDIKNSKRKYCLTTPPTNTIVCDRIKLKKLVAYRQNKLNSITFVE